MTDDLLTIDETAELLRLAAGTLRQWRHRSVGPASFKVGSRVVYRRSVVEQYIAAQEQAQSA